MPRKIGIVASQAITGVVAPTLSIGAATNFNQNIATFNVPSLTTSAPCSVVFQYSTASNFSSFSSATGVGSPYWSTSNIYVNVTGLTENTTYYVRAVATNSAGSTTTGSVSFATWHVVTDIRTPTPSGYGYATTSGSMTLPTVTPTNGTEVDPALLGYGLMGSGAYHGGAPSGRSGAGAAGWRAFAWSWYNFLTPSGYPPGNRTFTYTLGGSALWDYANRPLYYSVASAGTDSTMTYPNGTVVTAGGGKLFEAIGYPGGDIGQAYKQVMYLATPSNPANQYDNYSNSSHGYVYRRWSTPRWAPIPGLKFPQTSTDVDTMTAIGGAGGAGSTTHSNVDGSHPGGIGIGLGVGGLVGGAGSSASTTGGAWNRNSPMPANSTYGSGLLQFNEADGAISSAGYAGGSRSNVRSVIVFLYYGP